MFVKPKPGVQVLDPHTRRPVPEAGAEVPEEIYWLRRLRDGDLAAATAPAPEAAPAPDEAAPETHA